LTRGKCSAAADTNWTIDDCRHIASLSATSKTSQETSLELFLSTCRHRMVEGDTEIHVENRDKSTSFSDERKRRVIPALEDVLNVANIDN